MSTSPESDVLAPLVLLCFDGSDDAALAVARAAEMLGQRKAVVLTVWEPIAVWEPHDPGAVLGAAIGTLVSKELDLDEIAADLAREKLQRGTELASAAGFEPEGRLMRGKTWRAICDVADELEAEPIVVGARGLGRVESMLLGSVSSAVVLHAKRPVLVVPSHGGD